jgi:hypothetical protein
MVRSPRWLGDQREAAAARIRRVRVVVITAARSRPEARGVVQGFSQAPNRVDGRGEERA